jgi:hypothetical protein
MEFAAELLLKLDGHFNYGLAYGALDEEAEGTWEFKDGAVFLTTVPTVKPPEFVVESDKPETSRWTLDQGEQRPIDTGRAATCVPDLRTQRACRYGRGSTTTAAFLSPAIAARPPSFPSFPSTHHRQAHSPLRHRRPSHHPALRTQLHRQGRLRAQKLAIENGVVMPRRDLELMLHFRCQPDK